MKKLFTLSLLALLTTQISFAQDPGFYPPEGSTFNSDSSEISLPDAMIDVLYNETISFYASDSITIDVAGESFVIVHKVPAPSTGLPKFADSYGGK